LSCFFDRIFDYVLNILYCDYYAWLIAISANQIRTVKNERYYFSRVIFGGTKRTRENTFSKKVKPHGKYNKQNGQNYKAQTVWQPTIIPTTKSNKVA